MISLIRFSLFTIVLILTSFENSFSNSEPRDEVQVVESGEYIVSKESTQLAYDRKNLLKLEGISKERGDFLCQLRIGNPFSFMIWYKRKSLSPSAWSLRANRFITQLKIPAHGRLEDHEPKFSREWFYVKYPPIDSSNRGEVLRSSARSFYSLAEMMVGFKPINFLVPVYEISTTMNSVFNIEVSVEEAERMTREQSGQVYQQFMGKSETAYELFEEVWCSR